MRGDGGEPTTNGSEPATRGGNDDTSSVGTLEAAEATAEVAVAATNISHPTSATDETRQRNVASDQAALLDGFEIVDESGELVRQRFQQFLLEFQDNEGESPYVEQARIMADRELDKNETNETTARKGPVFSTTLLVDFSHVLHHDTELAEAIQSDMVRFERYLRQTVRQFMYHVQPQLNQQQNYSNNNEKGNSYFVALYNLPMVLPLRKLRTHQIGQLCSIAGTVTRTSQVRPELLMGSFRCQKCGLLAQDVEQHYHFTRPTLCRNPRCQNKSPKEFTLDLLHCEFCDWQKLRVQENPHEIPPGSMPRSMDVIVRNEMVERAKAGDACVFTGSWVVLPDGSALARAGEAAQATRHAKMGARRDPMAAGSGGVRGLQACGVRELTYRTCFVATTVLPVGDASVSGLAPQDQHHHHDPSTEEIVREFSEPQIDEIRTMKSMANLYDLMVDSIAPATFGHREVKKGILLMLLGGIHKTTAEGMKLRGDVNVCIVGDPSTAKSQFLKYVHSFLPNRVVYTSGKASSSAGLTAAVQRDSETGEFCIEAGALMLADNGIVCIDEFDKMDPSDQVAIHEAMEQQTISITKAGIQATLNARASILAAANPLYGRYDRTKTLKANVNLSAPILSRFDLLFVVLDECNLDSDRQVARHILKVHRCEEEAVQPPFTKEQMQRYIRFAKTLNPKITVESQRVLVDCYRKLRQGDTLGRPRTAYRITVRQLESMIRLSEALARLHCDDEVKPSYVREAFRLLKTSIIQVETSAVDVGSDDEGDDDNGESRTNVEARMEEGTNEEDFDTQPLVRHPGELGNDESVDPRSVASKKHDLDKSVAATESSSPPKKKRKKTKVQISFEEYETITHALATRLRTLEQQEMDAADEEGKYQATSSMTWKALVQWYLEQCEHEIGDSMEKLEELRKKLNLVIRRLIQVDRTLIVIGETMSSERETETRLSVHPNYVIQ